MAITFKLEGMPALQREWQRLKANVGQTMTDAVQSAVKEGADEARSTHRYKDQTGNLTEKTTGRIITATFGSCEGEIIADTKYALFVSDGTKPHEIAARRAVMLAWQQPQGDWHFAKKVQHPGTKADPFMGNAYLKAERVLLREIEVGIDKAARTFES